jgi:hypothetical protein
MASIDRKSGCRIVARRRVVARTRSIDAVGPYGSYGIQKRIIPVIWIVLRMQSVSGDSTIFLHGPFCAPDSRNDAVGAGTQKNKAGETQRNKILA